MLRRFLNTRWHAVATIAAMLIATAVTRNGEWGLVVAAASGAAGTAASQEKNRKIGTALLLALAVICASLAIWKPSLF